MAGHLKPIGLAALLSFGVAAFGSITWGALIVANARLSPSIPWSVPVMAAILAAYWWYLGGRGWPQRTRVARAALLRARLVPAQVFGLAWLSGGLALVALAGLWVVLVQLTGSGGNPTESQLQGYPLILVVLAIAMGSLVSPITEEASFRGYAQVILERRYSPLIAIAISSAFFAAWHGPTQGFFWSKLLFFFLVGVVFGTIAYLTNSTLPAIPVHIAGDLLFFIAIWPQDAHRHLVGQAGPDTWFWISIGQVAVFGALAVLALGILAAVRPTRPAQVTAAAPPS